VSGPFKPGDRLEELSLAEEFGVSRTPVREALRQLQEAGLIEIKLRRGAAVVEQPS
jgi:DNA-binding GntR family transcriptional regulator